jgi:hypothetical protein
MIKFYEEVEGTDVEKIRKEIDSFIKPLASGDPKVIFPLITKSSSFF